VVSYLEEVNTLEALVEIRIIQDPSHPCNGQRGLFALRDLPSGIFIGEYCGIAIHQLDSEGLLNNQYLADYDNMYHNYAGHIRIDAQNIGNETRYINDFRGIKDSNGAPNARFNKVWLDRMRCMVEIIDFVPKDKEITVDYGEQYWSLKRHLLTPSYRNLMQSQ
jgi:SET domain-containing protein